VRFQAANESYTDGLYIKQLSTYYYN